MCLLGPLAFQVFSQGWQESSIVIGCLTNLLNGHRTCMASMGPEVPPDSSGAPLSVGVDVKSSAVSDSERCAWCQLIQWHRPLGHLLLLSCLWVPLHRARLVSPCLESPSATSIYILLLHARGFAVPQACAAVINLNQVLPPFSSRLVAGSLHICSGPGTAWLSCRSHQGLCGWEGLIPGPSVALLVPGQGWCCLHCPMLQPPLPAGHASNHCCIPCCPCLSIKPVSRSQWAHYCTASKHFWYLVEPGIKLDVLTQHH